jgi:hypothetical protein
VHAHRGCLQGFCSDTYQPNLAGRWHIPLKALAWCLLIGQIVATVSFCAFAVIGQQAGQDLTNTLVSLYPSMAQTVLQLDANATDLQRVATGQTLIAGQSLTSAFAHFAPQLVVNSKVL